MDWQKLRCYLTFEFVDLILANDSRWGCSNLCILENKFITITTKIGIHVFSWFHSIVNCSQRKECCFESTNRYLLVKTNKQTCYLTNKIKCDLDWKLFLLAIMPDHGLSFTIQPYKVIPVKCKVTVSVYIQQ